MREYAYNPMRARRVWRLGRVAGIPIETDFGSLLLAIVVFLFINSALSYTYPEWSEPVNLALAFMMSLVLLASVLGHELGHSLVALRLGVKVRRISISLLGGVSHIPEEPDTPRKETLIALAGPAVSVAFGLFFGAGWLLLPQSGAMHVLTFFFASSALVNFAVAAFNLLPGLPLDGGRILRAQLWAITNNYDTATRLSSYAGIILGLVMLFGGLWLAFANAYYIGSVLSSTGLFVIVSAALSSRYNRWQNRLRLVSVGQLAHRDYTVAEASMPLGQLLTQHLLQRPFVLLSENGQISGAVSLTDAKKIASSLWWHVPGRSVMTPFQQLLVVYPDTTALQTSSLMQQRKTSLAVVMATPGAVDVSQLVGVVAQHHLHAAARRK